MRMTIADRLVAELRDEIRSATIPPGTRLRQAEVAARFEVSTTPVREAFAALERDGLLVGSPHHGVMVFQPTVDDLTETYEIRIPLEALATELAVMQATNDDIDELEAILEEMASTGTDWDRYSALNSKFHATIYRAAKRPKLARLIQDLRDESAAYLQFWGRHSPLDTQRDHTEIFEACKSYEPKRAAKAMVRHLERSADHVRAELEKLGAHEIFTDNGAPKPTV